MSILDRLIGRDEPQPQPTPTSRGAAFGAASPGSTAQPTSSPPQQQSADEQAVARYRYMLQTAPPETIEQAHAEAFARLTPDQRRMVLQQLSQSVPEAERTDAQDDPQSLARLATRAEIRQPGFMERTFGGAGMGGSGMMGGGMMGAGGGIGMGGLIAGGLFSSIAGSFIGSAIAHQFFSDPQVVNNFYQANPDQAAADNVDAADGANADPINLDENSGGDFGNNDLTVADASSDADLGGDDFGSDLGGDF